MNRFATGAIVVGGMVVPYSVTQLAAVFSQDQLARIAAYDRGWWVPSPGDIGDDSPERQTPRTPPYRHVVSFSSGMTTTVQAYSSVWFGLDKA